jgi:hypothetical protein
MADGSWLMVDADLVCPCLALWIDPVTSRRCLLFMTSLPANFLGKTERDFYYLTEYLAQG